jgi:hypothetical protein
MNSFLLEYLKLPSKVASINFLNNSNSKIKDSTWSVAYGLCVFGLTTEHESKSEKIIKDIKNKIIDFLKNFSV